MRERWAEVRDPDRDEDEAEDPPGAGDGGLDRPPHAGTEADQDRSIGARLVHHLQRVTHVFPVGVRFRAGGSVGPAVPTWIERHDPEVPSEIGNLGLPHPRMDDRPGWHEEDGRRPLSVY